MIAAGAKMIGVKTIGALTRPIFLLAETYTMIDPNHKQIGGDHYCHRSIQPWDVIAFLKLDFFEGNVLKYISRWRQKGGIQDLEKAQHYLEKKISIESTLLNRALNLIRRVFIFLLFTAKKKTPRGEILRFSKTLCLLEEETKILEILVSWKNPEDIVEALQLIAKLKEKADGSANI